MEEEKTAAAITLLCPHCLAENAASAHLCKVCYTPLSGFAATDPVLSIGAEMDTFGKAANAPHKPIVVLGMWLIMGAATIWLLLMMVNIVQDFLQNRSESPGGALIAGTVLLVVGIIPVGLLYKTTKNYVKREKEQTRGFPVQEDTSKIEEDEAGEWDEAEEPT